MKQKAKLFRYLMEDVTRHGQVRLYYREPGQPKIRIWVSVEHPDFIDAYAAAKRGEQLDKPIFHAPQIKGPKTGSFDALCEQYFKSAAFAQLKPVSQQNRRVLLKHCRDHTVQVGPGVFRIGDAEVAKFNRKHVQALQDSRAGKPEAANNRVKAVRGVFAWHQEGDENARNPAAGIKPLKSRNTSGYHSWTLAEIAQYEAAHPIGTMARLALDLALYTSQRKSDVVLLGPEHVDDTGWLVFDQQKTGTRVEIPIIDRLADSIAARPVTGPAFLMTIYEKPFTAAGIGIRFRGWCDDAGLPARCAMHGLRKATAARLAELGCGDKEIGAITGHLSMREIARYTKGAQRRILAASAMAKLKASLEPKQDRPTSILDIEKSGAIAEEETV